MPPRARNLEIASAAAQRVAFRVTDAAGTTLDLTLYGARATIRGSYQDRDPVIVWTMGAGIELGSGPGLFVLTVSADDAAAIAAAIAEGVWDLFLDPTGTPGPTSWCAVRGCVRRIEVATR